VQLRRFSAQGRKLESGPSAPYYARQTETVRPA
jgi:hypothetical protein